MAIEDLIQHLHDAPPAFPVIHADTPAINHYIHLERGENGSPKVVLIPEDKDQLRTIILLLNQYHASAVIFAGNTGLVSAQRATDNAVIDMNHLSQLHKLTLEDGTELHFSHVPPDMPGDKKAAVWTQEVRNFLQTLKNTNNLLLNTTVTCDSGVAVGTINAVLEPLGIEIPINTGAIWAGGGMTVGGGIANATHGGYGLLHGTFCNLVIEAQSINGNGKNRRDTGPTSSFSTIHEDRCVINSATAQHGDSALGTQGTFALIHEATLSTSPIPKQQHYLLVKEKNIIKINSLRKKIQQYYSKNFRQCELMSRMALELVRTYEPDNFINPFLNQNGQPLGHHTPINAPYVTLLEFIEHENEQSTLGLDVYTFITETLGYDDMDIAYAGTEANAPEAFMHMRHAISTCSTRHAKKLGSPTSHRITPDISVPLIHLEDFSSELTSTLIQNNYEMALFGHVGIGAFHLHVFSSTPFTPQNKHDLLQTIYDITASYDGSCWSEHGIGTANAQFYKQFTPAEKFNEWLNYVKKYDPNNVLNPHSNNFSAFM